MNCVGVLFPQNPPICAILCARTRSVAAESEKHADFQ